MKARLKAFVICFLLLSILWGCKKELPSYNGVEFILNTFVTQQWQGENAKKCYDEINLMLRQAENKFSPYIEESEIAKINKQSGIAPVKISEDTFAVLKTAHMFCEESEGLFDITVTPLVQLWDITGENPKVPKEEEITKAQKLISYEKLILDEKSQTAFLTDKGMGLDLGGVLKGYLADEALKIAYSNDVNGYISLGGNIAVRGKKEKGEDFNVGIRNPRGDAQSLIGSLSMEGLTLSTAGDYERFFMENGERYHHILNPFTGFPANNGLISVSVLSSKGAEADFLSTYILLSGKENLEKFLKDDSFHVLAVDEDFNVYSSKGFKERFKINDSIKDFNFINE